MEQGAYCRSVPPVSGIDERIPVLVTVADIGLATAKWLEASPTIGSGESIYSSPSTSDGIATLERDVEAGFPRAPLNAQSYALVSRFVCGGRHAPRNCATSCTARCRRPHQALAFAHIGGADLMTGGRCREQRTDSTILARRNKDREKTQDMERIWLGYSQDIATIWADGK